MITLFEQLEKMDNTVNQKQLMMFCCHLAETAIPKFSYPEVTILQDTLKELQRFIAGKCSRDNLITMNNKVLDLFYTIKFNLDTVYNDRNLIWMVSWATVGGNLVLATRCCITNFLGSFHRDCYEEAKDILLQIFNDHFPDNKASCVL